VQAKEHNIMKDRPEKKHIKTKQPYTKPEVKQVPLRPEEAVLGFCKTETVGGPMQSACTSPIICTTVGT
jgi:hypothetical protein